MPATGEERTRRIARPDPMSWRTFDLTHLIPPGGGSCLDLGCGPGVRADIERYGYFYVGADIRASTETLVVADAGCLPFRDGGFDLVVAASSFEHFQNPWAAAREVSRVLRAGGTAVVSLSFLEPYHDHSHFHMSHLGAARLFDESGLEVEVLEPFEWTGPEAIAQAMFQFAPARWMTGAIVRPVLWLRGFVAQILIRLMHDSKQRARAKEFLEEERFRFCAGIKLKLKKPHAATPD